MPRKKDAPKITSTEIRAALRYRYAAPEWVMAAEVAPATGFGATRRADVVAMNCYESRGQEIHGVEIKVSRSDWLSEVKNPDKAEEGVIKFCDRWYVATAPDIVQPGELPPTWGHLVWQAGRMFMAKEAPKLNATPPTRTFMASFLRRAGGITAAEINSMVKEQVEASTAEINQRFVDFRELIHMERTQRQADSRAFFEVFGFPHSQVKEEEFQRIAPAIRQIIAYSPLERRNLLEQTASRLQEAIDAINHSLITFDE